MMTVIVLVSVAVIIVALLYFEFSVEKITREERKVLAGWLSAFADEMEYSEVTITPDHIRDFAKDLEGDLS